ncbi:hypothetical protein D3C74_427480 [compost metagenome]
MIAFDQPDVLHFGANFQYRGASFDLKVFDDSNRISIVQNIAVGIPDYLALLSACMLCTLRPLMPAFRANQKRPVLVRVLRAALRAVWQFIHDLILHFLSTASSP